MGSMESTGFRISSESINNRNNALKAVSNYKQNHQEKPDAVFSENSNSNSKSSFTKEVKLTKEDFVIFYTAVEGK